MSEVSSLRHPGTLHLVPGGFVPQPGAALDEAALDRQAAALLEEMKWAMTLPYEQLRPESQALWRDVVRVLLESSGGGRPGSLQA